MYKKWLSIFILPINGTLIGNTTLSQSKPGGTINEGLLHIPQNSGTEASPSDSHI